MTCHVGRQGLYEDQRDWNAIRAWSASIARALRPAAAGSGAQSPHPIAGAEAPIGSAVASHLTNEGATRCPRLARGVTRGPSGQTATRWARKPASSFRTFSACPSMRWPPDSRLTRRAPGMRPAARVAAS
jgi:hypothetical protein